MDKKNIINIEEIKNILAVPGFEQKLESVFFDLHSHEVRSLLKGLEIKDISTILLAIKFPKSVEVFEEFDDDIKKEILLCFDKKDRARFIEEMAHDERVDLMRILPEEVKDDIYRLIAQAERNDIKKLLQYEEGSVGSVMTTEYAALSGEMTVGDALSRLRIIAPNKETIYYIYITNQDNNLIGFVSLKQLILSKPDIFIKDIMDTEVITLNVYEEREIASKMISDYDVLAMPVVDNDKKLVGIVTVDDIVDVVIEEDTEDIMHYGAVEKHINYLRSNPFSIARQRVIWLFVLVVMGFLSGYILERYKVLLDTVVPLMFFIPLLCAAGGNAGTQASTVIIRSLATGEIGVKDAWSVFIKEITIGAFMGSIMGIASAIRAHFVGQDIRLSFVVGFSMVLIVLLANAMAAILPMFFKKMKVDPALMSGPLIASIIDVCCIWAYLETARFVYQL